MIVFRFCRYSQKHSDFVLEILVWLFRFLVRENAHNSLKVKGLQLETISSYYTQSMGIHAGNIHSIQFMLYLIYQKVVDKAFGRCHSVGTKF